jgi:DNA-directed RNA polymerase specialized sigma24 family protein
MSSGTDWRKVFRDARRWASGYLRASCSIPWQEEQELLSTLLALLAHKEEQGRLPADNLLRPFVIGVTKKLLYAFWRKQHRDKLVPLDDVREPLVAGSQESRAILNQQKRLLWEAIQTLRPTDKDVFLAVVMDELSFDQIHQRLGCSKSTAWSRLRSAHKCLHLPLGRACIDGEVIDEAGKTVKDCTVCLSDNGDPPHQTFGSGRFFFEWLEPGVYKLHVEAPGYLNTDMTLTAVAGCSPAPIILVSAKQPITGGSANDA